MKLPGSVPRQDWALGAAAMVDQFAWRSLCRLLLRRRGFLKLVLKFLNERRIVLCSR
jgi:hypothetical protein